jgi:hypothetical protein
MPEYEQRDEPNPSNSADRTLLQQSNLIWPPDIATNHEQQPLTRWHIPPDARQVTRS